MTEKKRGDEGPKKKKGKKEEKRKKNEMQADLVVGKKLVDRRERDRKGEKERERERKCGRRKLFPGRAVIC